MAYLSLGMYVTAGLCNSANINNIISKVNYRLSVIKKVLKYTDYRTSKMLINSTIISIFKYGCPILINSSQQSLNKSNSLLLKCTRPILGFQSYKWSRTKILNNLKWSSIFHMVVYESIMFIHKATFENYPKSICNMLTFSLRGSQNIRSIRKPMVKREPICNKDKNTLIFKSIYLYNKMPDIFRTYNPKKLKKPLKEFIYNTFSSNFIPKYD